MSGVMAEIDETEVLDGSALATLYEWIDAVPLSRPKKTIARDFSDGVMVSEVIHHYLPRAVDIHNYVAASSTGQKRINWNTLNRKVFAKMNIKLNDTTLNQIVEAKPGAIEQVLWDLRRKIIEHAGETSRIDVDAIIASAVNSKSTLAYGNLAKATPSSHMNYSKTVIPMTLSNAKIRDSNHGLSVPVAARSSFVKTNVNKLTSGFSRRPPLPKPLPNSRNASVSSAKKAAAYCESVVPERVESQDQFPGDSNANSNASNNPGSPPGQIIYRGHKMVPVQILELKDKEVRDLENTKKSLLLKIDRLEKLVDIKDHRIEDLNQQALNLRLMYERVTLSTLDGNSPLAS